MKKILFSMVLVAAIFTACSKITQITEQTIDISTLPEKALTHIAETKPDATITSAVQLKNSKATFVAICDHQEQIAFDSDGEVLGNGVDYRGDEHGDGDKHPDGDGVSDGHGNHGNGGGHHDGGGHHGNGGGHGGGHHGDGGGPHDNEVSLDSLPASVVAYLAANFAGYTPKHAEIDSLCSVGTVLEIAVFKDSTDRVKLFFNPTTGDFLMKSSRVDYTTVPAAVSAFVTATYAGFTPRKRTSKLTLADGSIQYLVFLKNGSTRKKVIIREDGTLVCEQ